MGIAIYIENRIHERVGSHFDSVEDEIMKVCTRSPRGSVFRDVMPHGDTMLNVSQLRRAISEISGDPGNMPGTTARILQPLAERALSINGYLYFVGD
jgi:hypothetical protein